MPESEKSGIFTAMISPEEYEILCSEEVQRAIAEARDRDPLEVALDRRVPHARLVATQVKYLARAAAKLPAFAAAQCILPSLAFEQASSERCAAHKTISGRSVLDLTCGLGVDAWALSKRFARVTALERDPVLARITARNLRRLGAGNVEVVCAPAEEFLQTTPEKYDWVYADPDRRSPDGRKLVRLEECSPDILGLRPAIERVSGRLCLKNSPLFDVDEAFRLFGRCRVEVVSSGGECKEVVVCADGSEPRITATALGLGSFSLPTAEADNTPCAEPFEPARCGWLVIPDVALRKARLACAHLRGKARIWSNEGYGFAEERPCGVIGRVFAIDTIEPYDPGRLRRTLRGRRVEILKHDFPLPAAAIARSLGVREGGDERLAFTRIGGHLWVIRLKSLNSEPHSADL